MSVRYAVRQLLAADTATLVPLLPGGIYPTAASGAGDVTALTRGGTPDAFDVAGDVIASAVVSEESGVNMPGMPLSFLGAIRVWLYQQYGRDDIEAAQARIAVLLHGARVIEGGLPRTLRFAGFGPSGVKDESLRDASVGWVRFQLNGLVAVPA